LLAEGTGFSAKKADEPAAQNLKVSCARQFFGNAIPLGQDWCILGVPARREVLHKLDPDYPAYLT